MNETIRATYRKGVFVPEHDPGLTERQEVILQIIPAQVKVGAASAQRKVCRYLLDHLSYMMGTEQPELIDTGVLVWRVPVNLTSPEQGVLGQAGSIDVDAETGELLLTEDDIAEINRNARDLVKSPPPETTTGI